MSRELKFRAWNKSEREMYLSPSEIEHLGSWFDSHLPGSLADKKNIIIMQYIGMKDNKAANVYDGDVVEIFDNEGSAFRYTIQWKQDSYMFAGINAEDWMPIEEFEGCQVIGNIHQNPELL